MARLFKTDPGYHKARIAVFWSYVNVGGPDDCWPWKLKLDKDGYGRFMYKGVYYRSNRIALQTRLKRVLTAAEQSLHKCDNPSCCNPRHLFVGSNADNTKDRHNKGRDARNAGSKNGASKLDESDVRAILERLARRESPYKIARDYGVCPQSIYHIRDGERWGSLSGNGIEQLRKLINSYKTAL